MNFINRIIKLNSIFLILFCLNGCGKWIDVPFGEMYWECKKDANPTEKKINDQTIGFIKGDVMVEGLKQVCAQGGLSYSGVVRCNGTSLQVKCK